MQFKDIVVKPDIFGGTTSTQGKFPYIAALGTSPEALRFNHECGGILIADNWILTAAHAADDVDLVVIGRQDLKSADGEVHTIDPENDLFCHSEYDSKTLENDLALIRVSRSESQTKAIRPIKIIDNDAWEFKSTLVTLAGWGDDPDMTKLKEVTVPLLDRKPCRDDYDWDDIVIDEQVLCTLSSTGGALNGDSGGPAMIQEGGEHILVGIISAGNGHQFPNKHSRITKYRTWITEVLSGNFENTINCGPFKRR